MIKIRIDRSFSEGGYNLWILKYDLQLKKTWVAKQIKLEWIESEPNWQLPDPSYHVGNLDAFADAGAGNVLKAFAEAAIEAGLVPNSTTDKKEQVQAMENNLNDLRKIVDQLFILKNE